LVKRTAGLTAERAAPGSKETDAWNENCATLRTCTRPRRTILTWREPGRRSTSPASSPSIREGTSSGSATPPPRQCYRNLSLILAHYGGTLAHLVKTTTYITHWAYRPLVAVARDEFFPAPPYPANTLVVVQGLAEPQFLVEIEGIAVL
jgi:enamine deaminase RidA (YjgF/YER057c/UK114 family)